MFGSGDNGEFTFLDCVTLLSYFISVENLEQNLSQNDKQDLQHDLAEKSDKILEEIHSHLEKQDQMLNEIRSLLNEKN